ncbi:MAG TPA: polysaccharide pyruvyl transferase family protein [Bryobacteraceae bacterium]|nr:polysaccharide pyruvyl transferase family protein [Bryobacteraceae bacterium]
MPDPARIFISGYYGYANPGDEAILTVILSQLRARLPDASFTVVSGTPEETARTHSVHAVLWSDPLAIAEAIRDSTLVITGGGGIFHDYGGFPENGLLTEGNWGLGFHVTAGLLAALFSKPLVIYGIGAGPLFSQPGRRYTRAVCEAASAITVRDEGSARLLQEIGVAPAKIQVTADPGFLFSSDVPPQRSPTLRVAVVIRHWEHGVNPAVWEAECAAGLDLFLARRGGEMLLLPFQQFPGQQEDDLAVAERVHAQMKHREAARVLRDLSTPQEKAVLLASCHLVAGMRLHSIIFSITAGVPFVALTYDEKVRQVVERTGRVAFGIAMEDLRGPLLAQKMEQALDTAPVDPQPFVKLARQNTDAVMTVLSHPRPSTFPLDLVRPAVMALLKTQNRLRDQKTNYDYQIRLQQEELDQLQPRVPELETRLQAEQLLSRDYQQRLAALEQQKASIEQHLSQSLSQSEAERATWASAAAHLEHQNRDLQSKLDALQLLHEQTLSDWRHYASEITRHLSIYRGQRAWRGMLALRKAYVLLSRQGWSGRLRFLPWLFSVLTGGGNLESEQLEFPLHPKPRD